MVIFAVLAQTLYGSLQGLGKLFVPGISLVIGAFVKYVLNVMFIPVYGEIVPVITSVIYQAIACIISFVFLFRYLKVKPNMKDLFLKPIIATLGMSIVVFSTYNILIYINIGNTIATITTLILAIISYIVFIAYVKVLNKDEVMQLPYGNKIWNVLRKINK